MVRAFPFRFLHAPSAQVVILLLNVGASASVDALFAVRLAARHCWWRFSAMKRYRMPRFIAVFLAIGVYACLILGTASAEDVPPQIRDCIKAAMEAAAEFRHHRVGPSRKIPERKGTR